MGKEYFIPPPALSASRYDVQTERDTEAGRQLMRGASRVMLVMGSILGTATLNFALDVDGMLSTITPDPKGTSDPLRSTRHEVMLPLNTLDDILPIGNAHPPASGKIAELWRADEADHLMLLASDLPAKTRLKKGAMIKLTDTGPVDGKYETSSANGDDRLTVPLKNPKAGLGDWSEVNSDLSGDVFDEMITHLRVNGNDLDVVAPGSGFSVSAHQNTQIEGFPSYDGFYEVVDVDGAKITLNTRWKPAKARNLAREAAKRRGVQFSNEAAFVAPAKLALDDPLDHEEVGRTISAWVNIPKEPTGTRTILAQRNGALKISVGPDGVKACLKFGIHEIELTDPATHYGEWVHYAVTIKTGKLPDLSMVATLELFKNGNPIDERQVIHAPDAPDSAEPPSGPHDEIDIGTMRTMRSAPISMDGDPTD